MTNDEGEQDFRAGRVTAASQQFFRDLATGVGVSSRTVPLVRLAAITEDEVVVNVPKDYVGFLVGRKGKHVRAMQEICSKQIRVVRDDELP